MSTQYQTDEQQLVDLQAGERSATFVIEAQSRRELTVHSCYLRLHEVAHDWWETGVIRLEATDAHFLDPLAAWAYAARQQPGSGDPRWAVHLAPVRRVEEMLRARLEWAP